MPTVLKEDGFIVRIWLNDHLPRQVHVFKGDGECVINLEGEDGKPSLREFYYMKRQEISKAIEIVGKYQKELIEKWDEIYTGQ